jgi:signal transduction histidine kinase
MVMASSNRAQRLAKVQMDFVTTVSHELRTPLAVISSAAENLADGVVSERPQLVEYGSVIKHQSRQLSLMVENILSFTATRNGQQHYGNALLEVPALIEAALANTATLIQAAGFRVERSIEPGLPPIRADRAALVQCLQNLITNAVKYGGEARWLGIGARVAEPGAGAREVQISVVDRGIGIDKADLPHIFEPFYRSPSVAAAQIHGTGLGLSLARSIAEAMQGRLSVDSTPGQGSRFTLHLPACEPALESAALEPEAAEAKMPAAAAQSS